MQRFGYLKNNSYLCNVEKIKIVLTNKERNKVMKYVVRAKVEINTFNVINKLVKENEEIFFKCDTHKESSVSIVECAFMFDVKGNVFTDEHKKHVINQLRQKFKNFEIKKIELSFYKLEIMDDSNNHDKYLVRLINECFQKDVERFNKIVSLFIHRDCDECEELNINTKMDEITETDIHDYLMNVSDNEDLNTIIKIFYL